jgi:hypothetical protein
MYWKADKTKIQNSENIGHLCALCDYCYMPLLYKMQTRDRLAGTTKQGATSIVNFDWHLKGYPGFL